MDWQAQEQLIKSKTKDIRSAIQQAALDSPGSEDTFRTKVSHIINSFCQSADIRFETRENHTLASGKKPDTLFSRLVIEYKAPNLLRSSISAPQNQKAVKQVEDYIEKVSKEEKRDIQKMAGIILDGHYLIFLKRSEQGWREDGPLAVNDYSVDRFLRHLLSLDSGLSLPPERLVQDFSIEQSRAQQVIRSLYGYLTNTKEPLVEKLFEQWRTFFSEAIEYKEAFSSPKLKQLKDYAHKAGIDLKEQAHAEAFFFAVHTYFALLVKFIAWQALSRYFAGKSGAPIFSRLSTISSDELKRELTRMEHGGTFRDIARIRNLLEGDFFRWYLNAWNVPIEKSLREIIDKLSYYDPTTLAIEPEASRDLLKKLYHKLMPRDIRHNLGEYYTPDWLAQRLLNQVNIAFFTNDPEKSSYLRENLLKLRFLDPACGSGTFLALIINRIREVGKQLQIPENTILDAVLNNVVGIDLNPLAVIAARTTYVLALGDLLENSQRQEIEIPVYLADSIAVPEKAPGLWENGKYPLPTVVGKFWVPDAVIDKKRFGTLCELLEEGVRDGIVEEIFLERCQTHLDLDEKAIEKAKSSLKELYSQIKELNIQHINGIWARILRNGFAPLFIGKFHYVVGNPPWVNWESLPDEYTKRTRELWRSHGLLPHKGMDTILGKGKKDISMLMTYEAMHRYLNDGGRLGFVITQSVFKTSGSGQGFRRFILGDSTPIKVLHVDDMVELNPFEGASNRTSIVILEKGKPTSYGYGDISYLYWKKTSKGKAIGFDTDLLEVMKMTQRRQFHVEPVDSKDKTSAWLTGRPLAIKAIRKVLGKSDYQAHEGVNSGGANAVFWVEILKRQASGLVEISNITEGQKREVPSETMTIEPDLLYPLIRGRDVKRWKAEPAAWIIMAQDPIKRRGIDQKEIQLHYPKTYTYLKRFENVLRSRAAYKRYFKEDAPFYSMFDVGNYTFAPHKVVWTRMAKIDAAVIESLYDKPIIPQETVTLVECNTAQEAHYIASLVNSGVFQYAALSYSQAGGKSLGSMHVLGYIRIPKFNMKDKVHQHLSQLSEKTHELARRGAKSEFTLIEQEIDQAAAELWNITAVELKEIKKAIVEL